MQIFMMTGFSFFNKNSWLCLIYLKGDRYVNYYRVMVNNRPLYSTVSEGKY